MGPLLGHVDSEKAIVWFRAAASGRARLQVKEANGRDAKVEESEANPENDLCVTWTIGGLSAAQEYVAAVLPSEATAEGTPPPCLIRTPADDDVPARVSLAFGSCASSTKHFEVWDRIGKEGADGIVLLGDTPYIDRTDLASNRKAHRDFLSIPNLAELLRTRPLWASWDDHDFGGNDSDGNIPNKQLIRKAFCEYRALPSYGDGEHGIYTSFRRGPVEVFLIDPRYFSQTEPSTVDSSKKTCLGKAQWEWLLSALERSTAAFKVLATGLIWDDKKNSEKDDWETYAHEREALYDFIAEKKITGVLLIGGDIHVSRHLKYPLKDRLGYDLHQCVVSPLHERTIPALNVPHPALVWGEAIPNVFMQLVADNTIFPAKLTCRWIDIKGKLLHQMQLQSSQN